MTWNHANCFLEQSPSTQVEKLSGWERLSQLSLSRCVTNGAFIFIQIQIQETPFKTLQLTTPAELQNSRKTAHTAPRNRGVALSVNEVRKVAETLRPNSPSEGRSNPPQKSPTLTSPRNRSPSPGSYPKSMNFFGLYGDLIGLFVLAFN